MRSRLFLALVAALLLAPAAHAADPATIAKALKQSPLYVDPSLRESASKVKQRAVLAALRALPYRTFVVLAPIVPGDRANGDELTFIDLVHDRLGKDGVYVALDDVITARVFAGPEGLDDTVNAATTVGQFESGDYDEPGIDKLVRFATALSDPNLAQRAKRVDDRLKSDAEDRPEPVGPKPKAKADAGGTSAVLWIVVAAVGLALAGLLIRRRARPAGDEPELPERVFEHAAAARDRRLREAAEALLEANAERAGDEHTLDAYSAARRLLTPTATTMELAAALVLADRAGRPPRPLCFFDPEHGRAASTVALRADVHVAACERCRRNPDPLLDGTRPWYEADSLWARTGLGAFDDDLAGRVLRGER